MLGTLWGVWQGLYGVCGRDCGVWGRHYVPPDGVQYISSDVGGGGGLPFIFCHELFFMVYSLIDIRLLKYDVYDWRKYLLCVGTYSMSTEFVMKIVSVNSIISWYHLQSSVWDNYHFKPSMITISARAANPHL